jgi:hypothetical protein
MFLYLSDADEVGAVGEDAHIQDTTAVEDEQVNVSRQLKVNRNICKSVSVNHIGTWNDKRLYILLLG